MSCTLFRFGAKVRSGCWHNQPFCVCVYVLGGTSEGILQMAWLQDVACVTLHYHGRMKIDGQVLAHVCFRQLTIGQLSNH